MTPTPTTATLQAIRIADEVVHAHQGNTSTHYESCWKHHAGCLAVLIRNILEGTR